LGASSRQGSTLRNVESNGWHWYNWYEVGDAGQPQREDRLMPQYLLSVHGSEATNYPNVQEMERAYRDVEALNDDLREQGAWVFAGGLHPASAAKVVRSRDGELLHTDGPYLESREHIGGFWIIDVPDEDAAMGWADKATIACQVAVEVRPFQAEPDA
jgi:hypothetical protein